MNRLIKPLIVLIILVGLVLVLQYTGTDRSRPDAEKSFQVKLDLQQIERVEISRAEARVTLLNGASGWSVKTPFGIKPADSEAILVAIKDLSGIENAQLVSHNPEKQAEYRLDDGSGSVVKFFGGGDKIMAEIVVGRLGGFEQQQQMMQMSGQQGINPQNLHTFMRHASSDDVYKVPGFFATIIGTDPDQWRDHNLCSFTADQIKTLALDFGDENLVLESDTAGNWSMITPVAGPANPDTVDQMLRSLCSLRADSFQDSALTDDELGLAEPAYRIAVELAEGEGENIQLEIGREFKENFFYARKTGGDQVYTLADYRLDQIMKRPGSVKAVKE
jgi:Domain of unknown function (DUF4340)